MRYDINRRRNTMGRKAGTPFTSMLFGFPAIFIIGALFVFLAGPIIHFSTLETTAHHVIVDKERVNTKDTSKYMVFTDKEVFENTDSMLALKWDSSDVYRKINIGDTCSFKVAGIRIPFMSSYRNILEANCQKGTVG